MRFLVQQLWLEYAKTEIQMKKSAHRKEVFRQGNRTAKKSPRVNMLGIASPEA